MKIQLSKTDIKIQTLILIIILLLLWIPAFIHISPFQTSNNIFFEWCFGWIKKAPFLGALLAFLLIFFNLFYLSKLLTDKHLKSVNTIYPAIIYLILMSNVSTFQLTPELIACTLLLLSLPPLFSMEEAAPNDNFIIKLSVIIGVAILFYPSIWICLLLPIFAISIFINLSVRKIFLSLLGTSFVWIWVLSVAFFTDSLSDFWIHVKPNIDFSLHQFYVSINWLTISAFVMKACVVIPVIFIVLRHSQNDLVINRRRMITTVIFLFLLVIGFFNANDIVLHANLLVLPETIIITYLYEHSKKVKLVGFILFVIFSIHLIDRWSLIF